MNFMDILRQDLDAGFSKTQLEVFIGLPQNCLSAVMKGGKNLSKKSIIKIERWEKKDKPDPLDINAIKAKNLEKKVSNFNKKSITNFTIDTLPNNSIKEEPKTNNKYALLNIGDTMSNSELEAKIANYKKELEIVPDVGFGKIRRKFLNSTIEKLSKQITLNNK